MPPSEAAAPADAIIGLSARDPVPAWAADLGWRAAADELSGDAAVMTIVDRHRREHPDRRRR
jgi:hypothetical protein